MSSVSIPKALAQMDGIFGCKVVTVATPDGKANLDLIQKKNFFEWICGIFFYLRVNPVDNQKMLAALDLIAEKIKDAETGDFAALLKNCRSTGKKIDLKEIKMTLQSSLKLEFPPQIYSKDAGHSKDKALVAAYKAMHIKNLKKSICMEIFEVPLVANTCGNEVTPANAKGFCEAYYDSATFCDQEITYKTNSVKAELSVSLACKKLRAKAGIAATDESNKNTKKLQIELAYFNAPGHLIGSEIYQYYRFGVEDCLAEMIAGEEEGSIEMLVDFSGEISDENISHLVSALLDVIKSKERNYNFLIDGKAVDAEIKNAEMQKKQAHRLISKISFPDGARELNTDIFAKVTDAYVERRVAD